MTTVTTTGEKKEQCMNLINEMPEDGLGECLEFLRDALEYWSIMPPPLVRKYEPVKINVTFTEFEERAPLIIGEYDE